MADTVINLTSQPTMPSGAGLNRNSWTFINSRLQSNAINNSVITIGYIKFNAVVGTVKATIGVSSEDGYDYMGLHVSKSATTPTRNGGNMANISGSTTGTYSYNITSAGTYYLYFFYAKDTSNYSGQDCGWITNVTLPLNTSETMVFFEPLITLPKDTTLNKGSWTQSIQYGLLSNPISNSGLTSGYVKFNAKVGQVKVVAGCSSEANYDYMSLHVSTSATVPSRMGGNMANISGNISSTTYTYNITTAGTYYLHFLYAKDGSGTSGNDCGWIESAVLPIATGGAVYTNVSGVWKQGTQYSNVSGVWKQGETYTNVSGMWKLGQ